MRNDFERDALLDDAERKFRAIKEGAGEHWEPDDPGTQEVLRQLNEWLDGFTAVKAAEEEA